MRKLTNKAIVLLLVATTAVLAGSPSVFAAGGADWWNFESPIKNGRIWTGVLSINLQVVDVTSQPERLIDLSSGPAEDFNDVRVQAIFTGRVESTVKGKTDVVTFSGIATRYDGGQIHNHFWLVSDAALITKAISDFFQNELFTDPTSLLYNGKFTWADSDPSSTVNSNVISQTQPPGEMVPGKPLYSIVEIEMQTPN